MKKIHLLFTILIILPLFTSCVSTDVKPDSGLYFENKQTNEKLLIDNWKYMGFNKPFPIWVIPALENNIEELKHLVPELSGAEIVVITAEGYNQDQAEARLNKIKKPVGYKLYDSFWVCTYSETGNKMYISVAVYRK